MRGPEFTSGHQPGELDRAELEAPAAGVVRAADIRPEVDPVEGAAPAEGAAQAVGAGPAEAVAPEAVAPEAAGDKIRAYRKLITLSATL